MKQPLVYNLCWSICSHYVVVVVIGSLPSAYRTPSDIPDNQLLPYDDAMRRGFNYYIATGGSSVNSSHTLGNEERITVDSVEYYNKRFTPDQQYSYFVRFYSQHVSWILAKIDKGKRKIILMYTYNTVEIHSNLERSQNCINLHYRKLFLQYKGVMEGSHDLWPPIAAAKIRPLNGGVNLSCSFEFCNF